MVAAPDAKGDAPAGEDVGGRIILGEAQGMPHRADVETTAEAQPLCLVGEVERRHQHIGDALHSLVLEMVLRHPERVVAQAVHQHRHRLGLVKDAGEVVVRVAAVVDRNPAIADVLDVDVAGVEAVEFADRHGGGPLNSRMAMRLGP